MYTLAMPRARLPRRGKFIANEQLKVLREARGLSQTRLAELVGCSQPDIQRLETGHARTTAEWTVRLAPHLGVEPQDLFPRAPGSPRPANGGGIDPDIMARAVAVSRRLESDSDAVASEIISICYALLARDRDGYRIIDDEATLALLETFARRLRRISPPR
jgi:transcriptional regulator with XRE-family HTH domain